MRQVLLKISQEKGLNNINLARIYSYLGEYEFRITQGSNSEIQLNALFNMISRELK
ncbi:hypothetical protein ES703_115555 [subsurface metagenome]